MPAEPNANQNDPSLEASRANRPLKAPVIDHGLIRRDQINAIARLTPWSMASNVLCSGIFVVATWGYFPQQTLLLWLVAVWGMSGLMLWSWARRRNALPATASRAAVSRTLRYAFLLGLPWGALATFMFGSSPLEIQLLIAALATGMAFSGGYALAAIPTAALTYTLTILAPLMVQCLLHPSVHLFALGAITLIYGTAFTASILSQARLTVSRAIDNQAVAHQNHFLWLLLHDFERNAHDWLWETDVSGRLNYCSDRLPAMLGRERANLLGLPLASLANGVPDPGWTLLAERMAALEPFNDVNVPVKIDNEVRWWALTARPAFGEEGEYFGYRGVGTDVSALRRAEEMRLAKEEAERAYVAKSRFLAIMSHELRTPLNAIIGFSDLIARETFGPIGEPRYLEYARDVQENSQHLLGIINDVLQMARAENGLIQLDEEKFAVQQLLEAIPRLLNAAAASGRVKIEIVPCPRTLTLTADYRLLKQILVNLVSNAIKFTPPGGVITVTCKAGENGSLLLSVKDTGIGVSAKDLEHIFEPFHQLDDQLQRRRGGVGLGLSIARQFARAHGGDIVFESVPGQGSTATLVLPSGRSSSTVSEPDTIL